MLIIRIPQDLSRITNRTVCDVDLSSLLVAFKQNVDPSLRHDFLVAVLAVMRDRHQREGTQFSMKWCLAHLGRPDYVNADAAVGYFVLFYVVGISRQVISVDFQSHRFDTFGVLDGPQFEELLRKADLPTWEEFELSPGS